MIKKGRDFESIPSVKGDINEGQHVPCAVRTFRQTSCNQYFVKLKV